MIILNTVLPCVPFHLKMLIMTLDPSWRQTLRLPPPGIEPGLPASQHIKFIGSRSKMTFMNCKRYVTGLKINQSSGYALFTPVVWSRGGKSNKHEKGKMKV